MKREIFTFFNIGHFLDHLFFLIFANTPTEMAIGLFAVGCFAAIYHPVGIAMVRGRVKTGIRWPSAASSAIWVSLPHRL